MLRKYFVIFAFLFAFSAVTARSLAPGERQSAASQADQSPAPQAQPPAGKEPDTGKEPAKPDEKSAPAKARSFTEDSNPFLADRHIASGLQCSNCHGDAATKQPVATDQCLKCHESFDDLSKKTEDITPNPHSNHLIDSSDIDCDFCHHGHKANEIGCHKCHADMELTRGSAATTTKTQ
jgi:fumarate reductase flavoprotein subunit